MSSRSSSQSQAASRTYRIVNLRRSHIYIDHLPKEQWPPWIIAFVEKLTQDGPGSIPVPLQPITEQSERLLPMVRRLVASVEPYWQSFSRTVIFRALIEAEGIANCQDQLWNEPVPLVQGELAPLSLPKPDLALGLAVHDDTSLSVESKIAPTLQLNENDLIHLRIHAALHPSPSTGTPMLAFPSIIYECKSDTQPIFFAENQAAGAVAKALRMQEGLLEAAGAANDPLPVLAFCSQGTIWRAFISFRSGQPTAANAAIHMERFWMGDILEQPSLLRLQVILCRILAWITDVYRPTIAQLVHRSCLRSR